MIRFDDATLKRYITEVKLLGEKDFVDVARESLNETANLAKKKTIQKSANEAFTVRNKTFFKAFTAVNYSKRGQSSTLAGLYSSVGMFNSGSKKSLSSNYDPLAEMEQMEHGGSVKREITPLNKSRISNTYNRAVSKTSMFTGNLITQSKMKGSSKRQRFKVAIMQAKSENKKFFLADEFDAIYSVSSSKIKRIFGYNKSKSNNIKATHFMENASREASEMIPGFFIKEAIKKIEFRASRIK